MPLQSRFLSQLDVLSDRLVKLFEKRGGQIIRQVATEHYGRHESSKNAFFCVDLAIDLYTSDRGKDSNPMTCSAYFP